MKTSLLFPTNKTKRWFVVDNISSGNNDLDEHVLCYYKNKSSKLPRGWIFLSDVKQIEESQTSRLISITHPSRVFRLEAPDENKHKAWLNSLSSLCMNAKVSPLFLFIQRTQRFKTDCDTIIMQVIQNTEKESIDLIPKKIDDSAIFQFAESDKKTNFMIETNNEVQLQFLRSICNNDSGCSESTYTTRDQSKIESQNPQKSEGYCGNVKLNNIQVGSVIDGFFKYNDQSNLVENMITQSNKYNNHTVPISEPKELLSTCDMTKRKISMKSGHLKKQRNSDHRLTPRLVKGDCGQTTNARLIKAIQEGQIPVQSIEKLDQNNGHHNSAQTISRINRRSKEDRGCEANENLLDEEENVKFQKMRSQIRSMGIRSLMSLSSSSSPSTNSSSSIEIPSNSNSTLLKNCDDMILNDNSQDAKLYLNQMDYPSMEPLLSSNNNDSSFEESESSYHFTDISRDRQMCYDCHNRNIESPISERDVKNIPKEDTEHTHLHAKTLTPNAKNMLQPDKNFVSEDWDVDSDNESNNDENKIIKTNLEVRIFRFSS